MDKFSHFSKELTERKDKYLFRTLRGIESPQGPSVRTEDGREMLLFCSNNYLNLANDPRILQAVHETVDQCGFGAAASRLISGTMKPHSDLENTAANLYQKQAALYFSSGWCANQAVLTTLPQKEDLVLIDRLNHASIIDAVRQGPATFRTYHREQTDRIEKYLQDPVYKQRYIVTETVFSMDGDCAELAALVELKNKYNAVLILDEAHAAGCMGKSGAGLADSQNLMDAVDLFVVPLGKAPASIGAIVASEKIVIDYLINKARPFIYTTAPPPASAAAANRALQIIQQEPDRRERLCQNADYLRNAFYQMGLNIGNSTTHIIPVILGDSQQTIEAARALEEQGLLILPIRPPTVPKGTDRLRISVQSGHTQEHLDLLCRGMQKALRL